MVQMESVEDAMMVDVVRFGIRSFWDLTAVGLVAQIARGGIGTAEPGSLNTCSFSFQTLDNKDIFDNVATIGSDKQREGILAVVPGSSAEEPSYTASQRPNRRLAAGQVPVCGNVQGVPKNNGLEEASGVMEQVEISRVIEMKERKFEELCADNVVERLVMKASRDIKGCEGINAK